MPLSLVVVLGKQSGGALSFVGEEPVSLGSGPGTTVELAGPGISPLHAWLVPYATGWEVLAAGPSPVRVNGVTRERALLEVDDHLAIGRAVLRVDDCTTPDAVRVLPARLQILAGGNKGGVYALGAGVTLGRGLESDVPLLDMRCSRAHARVIHRREGYHLVDVGSTNGTLLNEERIKPGVHYRLSPGDWIRAGRSLLEFQWVRDPSAAPRPPAEAPALPTERLKRRAPTFRVDPASGPALEGTLERLGFADLIQFLAMSRKTGELVIAAPAGECGIGFSRGKVVDAWSPYGWGPEETFFSLARLKAARFAFHEGVPPRGDRIQRPTPALLLEAARLIDEATDVGAVSG